MSKHVDTARKLPFGRVVPKADAYEYYLIVAILAGCIGISRSFWTAAAEPFYGAIAYTTVAGLATILIILAVLYYADRKLGREAPRVTSCFALAFVLFGIGQWFTSPWLLLAAFVGFWGLLYVENNMVARRAAPLTVPVEDRWPGDTDSTETR